MTDAAGTEHDGRGVAFEDVQRAVGARLWKLAPDEFQRAAHMDLMFRVNMQDLLAAVEDGLDDAVRIVMEEESNDGA
jgi:hypothetical protein